MANTTEWQTPGDYNLIELSLAFHDNSKIDITNNASQIDLFESLYASSMEGTIIFKDDTSILESYNIRGSEKVIFKMSTSVGNDFHTIDKVFNVAKISDFISEGKEQYYTLHLVSPIVMIDKNYKISKSYDDYAENIINTIYQDTMGFSDSIISDSTKYPRKIVVPRITPLNLFKYLAESSIDGFSDDDLDAGFVFYESSVGFNFRYLKGLYDEGVPFNLIENGKSISDQREHLDIVNNAYLETMFNNVDNQMIGVFGNTVISHNIINKTITTEEFGYAGTLSPNVGDYSTNNRFYMKSANYDNANANKWSQTKDGNNQVFDNYNLILSIFGNSNVTVGQTVNYDQKSNVFGEDGRTHRIFHPKHLITAVRHTIIDGIYSQTLECSNNRWNT